MNGVTGMGKRIRKLRGDTSVTAFCNHFGVHRNTLPRYESGNRTSDADFIVALCSHYRVSHTWLLTGEGEVELSPIGEAAETIGSRIKQLRGETTQKNFAAQFGVTADTIRRYEFGKNPPAADFIVALCTRYQIDANWLLFGAGRDQGDDSGQQDTFWTSWRKLCRGRK